LFISSDINAAVLLHWR